MDLTFLGAATTVTGSQFLLETRRARILVDCGMFQGGPNEAIRNRVPRGYEPADLDAILLTHAHLDHCGLIPVIVREGFRGPIRATAGTIELARLVLMDSGRLQEEFAKRETRFERRNPEKAAAEDAHDHRRFEAAIQEAAAGAAGDAEAELRAQPADMQTDLDEPLYTEDDAVAALRHFRPVRYDVEEEVAPGIHATYLDAGHILGSAIIRVRVTDEPGGPERIIVFSGDLGKRNTPIIRDPTRLAEADYVLCESTYGGREHEPESEARRVLAEVVRLVAEHDGVLLVPSFAIGRTQELIWALDRLVTAGEIPALPLYLDSPMAREATSIYRGHAEYFDEETRKLLEAGDTPLDYPGQRIVKTVEESRAIARAPRPYMVVASNGMLTGGRVLGHLGEGTLGRHLQDGATTARLDGAIRRVRCQVRSVSGFSAHADEPELLDWLAGFAAGKRAGAPGFPRRVFLVHGDPGPQAELAPKVSALGFDVHVPHWHETVTLD
jgi:metallo-beta-lactamase family protein